MRADRLLSLLMLLQTRGRMTAHRLADELEVSLRTIYRDLYALRVAGFPVYTERGPGGGCRLHEAYRTRLTDLTRNEISALFAVGIPAPLPDLQMSRNLRAALLKLTAALPEARWPDEARLRSRIHLDSTPWFQSVETTPFLPLVEQALWDNRQVEAVFRRHFGTLVSRTIHPYGLAAKGNVWYVVWNDADGRLRVDRVASIVEARLLDEGFECPKDFDLACFWAGWSREREESRVSLSVRVRAREDVARYLVHRFQKGREPSSTSGESTDWTELVLGFEWLDDARRELLPLGGAVEVIEPEALRRSMADYAEQIAARYAHPRGALEAGGCVP
jgi:predicted DNA-binding transcriptional regulator YafY